MEENKVSADVILDYLKALVESKKMLSKDEWLSVAFRLNLLRIDEAQLLNKMRQSVAQRKLEVYQKQEKRNVAAADLEVESSDEFRFMKDQEEKLWSIDEFVRISKKSADLNF